MSGLPDPGQSPREVRNSAPSALIERNATGADSLAGEAVAAADAAPVGDALDEAGDLLPDGDVLPEGDEVGVAAGEEVRDAEVSGGGGAATCRNINATRNTSAAMKSTSPAIDHRPPRTAPPHLD
jgi:hypothetical protein